MKFLAIFMMFLLAMSFVAAEEITVDPGVLPDEPFKWGLDKAWDRISEITGGNERARVNSLERIEELRALSTKFNATDMTSKQLKHLDKSIKAVQDRIDDGDINETTKEYGVRVQNMGLKISEVAQDTTLSKEQKLQRFAEIKALHQNIVKEQVAEIKENRLHEALSKKERAKVGVAQ